MIFVATGATSGHVIFLTNIFSDGEDDKPLTLKGKKRSENSFKQFQQQRQQQQQQHVQ